MSSLIKDFVADLASGGLGKILWMKFKNLIILALWFNKLWNSFKFIIIWNLFMLVVIIYVKNKYNNHFFKVKILTIKLINSSGLPLAYRFVSTCLLKVNKA